MTYPLRIDGWKMKFPFEMVPFQVNSGDMLIFGRLYHSMIKLEDFTYDFSSGFDKWPWSPSAGREDDISKEIEALLSRPGANLQKVRSVGCFQQQGCSRSFVPCI